ncbi:MAG: carbohydrate ABC transporter permease [Treponema sp.]|nr:carbohydrate ABC transporter permease [Treponema sp.]
MIKRFVFFKIDAHTPLSDRIFYIINSLVLFLIVLICLYPIVYIASSSFSSPRAVISGKVILLPVEPGIEGYKAVFKNQDIITGYINSFIYMAVGTILNVICTIIAAFALSRRELVGFKFLNFLFVFTMWFSGGMIPSYILMTQLHLINTRWALWLPGLIGVWNMVITRTFFESSIPGELYESAMLDGCGYFRYFKDIVLPLSGAIVAVITLFYAVNHWNAYFNAFLYISKQKLYPLQIVLRNILIQNQINNDAAATDAGSAIIDYGLPDLLKYSLIMVACVPVWCLYPFVQRFFVKGIMVGAIKG